MVRDGVAFTNAYMMGGMSGATCIPSRAMLLSGRSLFRLCRYRKVSCPNTRSTTGT